MARATQNQVINRLSSAALSGPPQLEWKSFGGPEVPVLLGEFWTSKQRQASSLHEISYRACYKPQLPRFFIELFSKKGDTVYDPFSGRGTTVIEAALLGRCVTANDINPLGTLLARPRLQVPDPVDLEARLESYPFADTRADLDLSMFFAPKTESEIVSLRAELLRRRAERSDDHIDRWIAMVATNRLTGHSPGFFSVYTLPPNQATSAEAQKRINRRRSQKPDYRDTRELILRKSRSLLRRVDQARMRNLETAARSARWLTEDAASTGQVADDSVQLTVTSPPFLDVVQYAKDNWLRCWFNGIDASAVEKNITVTRSLAEWKVVMAGVLAELFRVTCPGGRVAFEVGEVRKGSIRLEESIAPLARAAGFKCEAVLINAQRFTKTAAIWGVDNNTRGTNSNRIVLLRKPV